jgi:hypothetical protein
MVCQHVKGSGFHSPIDTVILQNAIQRVFFTPHLLIRTQQCDPVSVAVGKGKRSYAQNPNAHLLCWSMSYTWKAITVRITNRFGTATLSTGAPTNLCLPTWANTTGPPKPPSTSPPGLDNFVCYPLTAIPGNPGFPPRRGVTVQLALKQLPIKVRVSAPRALCVPSVLIDSNTQYSPQASSDRSLTCFTVSKLPMASVYYDQNLFGHGISRPTATLNLCVPTTIQVEGPTA